MPKSKWSSAERARIERSEDATVLWLARRFQALDAIDERGDEEALRVEIGQILKFEEATPPDLKTRYLAKAIARL